MGKAEKSRDDILCIARQFRQSAEVAATPDYAELMTRTAEDLEALAEGLDFVPRAAAGCRPLTPS
ncbi:MAG TPA: hypothetical protein VMH86_16640 [Rhizomicrobium sp.]|nr:hypothetical protein [Rhizomicrobium sp.]